MCYSRSFQLAPSDGSLRPICNFLHKHCPAIKKSRRTRSCGCELRGRGTICGCLSWYVFYLLPLTLGIPLAAAAVTRLVLIRAMGPQNYKRRFIDWVAPLSLIGLLFTIIILFASQGRNVVQQIIIVVRVSAPLIVYFAIIFLTTLYVCRRMHFEYKYTSVQSFTAASNNFELAIAVAIATFGANSNQALAATVGPLIEVPVLLALVYLMRVLRKRWHWGKPQARAIEPPSPISGKEVV